jgi:hypothetical protein
MLRKASTPVTTGCHQGHRASGLRHRSRPLGPASV